MLGIINCASENVAIKLQIVSVIIDIFMGILNSLFFKKAYKSNELKKKLVPNINM